MYQAKFSHVFEGVGEGYFLGISGANQKLHTLYSVCPHPSTSSYIAPAGLGIPLVAADVNWDGEGLWM